MSEVRVPAYAYCAQCHKQMVVSVFTQLSDVGGSMQGELVLCTPAELATLATRKVASKTLLLKT